MSSSCDVLHQEPKRFAGYVLLNKKLRETVYDKKSFASVFKKILEGDSSLKNMIPDLTKHGESLEDCASDIYDLADIQALAKNNLKLKRKEFRQRIKTENPKLGKKEIEKELSRRLKILIATEPSKTKASRQVTIDIALKPVKVSPYQRDGKRVDNYRKSKNVPLTSQERMLIENNVKRGKTPTEVVQIYNASGLGYRTPVSLKNHYFRIKSRLL